MYVITTFYKFVDLQNLVQWRSDLLGFCNAHSIKGTVLLADEGINATVVGKKEDIDCFYSFMRSFHEFHDLFFQESQCDFKPFQRMKVKIKPQIVTFRVSDVEVDMQDTGAYIQPKDWDNALMDKDFVVIDTRNSYEIAYGSFKNAVNPNTNNFSELKDWVYDKLGTAQLDRPIAMFCTGGVRCERSTAYLKALGYRNVYHLQGGILNYLQYKKDHDQSMWEGRCFIFDDRIALNPDLTPA